MKNKRKAYKKLVSDIEKEYPVNKWIYNGYHIWPVLRICLLMNLIKQERNVRKNKKKSKRTYKLFFLLKNMMFCLYKYVTLKKNISNLYVGAPSHRVEYKGEKYNRYFDLIMDKEEASVLLLEYGARTKKKYYKSERVFLISYLLTFIKIFERLNPFYKLQSEFAIELDTILKRKNIRIENFILETNNFIANVDRSLFVFSKLLKKIDPKKVHMLCYYSSTMLGLTIACDKLKIPSVDVQHGPQGEYHLAYDAWKAIPEDGYEALPNEFHTWDSTSAQCVNKWARNTTKHSAVVTGNPWIEGWKKGDFEKTQYGWPSKIILYTLQPIGNPLEPYLLNAIKTSCDKWDWWLRVHPRQLGELKDLKKELAQYDLIEQVNIEDATNLPLPEILLNTKVHVTKSSGCAIEAFSFGVPTILIDLLGESYFKDYMKDNIMVTYLDKDEEGLIKKIQSHL